MIRKIVNCVMVICTSLTAIAQNEGISTTTSGAALSEKASTAPVDLFSGKVQVNVPLYAYTSTSGIGINVSLNYEGGNGIGIAEQSTMVGLGWNLNIGGASVVRIMRGAPDDYPGVGYIHTPAIPTDFRSKANTYFNHGEDAELDVFQFSIPGASGRFYIGKNKQVVIVPASKVIITPFFENNGTGQLQAFTITSIDGTKYTFDITESLQISVPSAIGNLTSMTGNSYRQYNVKWHFWVNRHLWR
jgi:hypothetical protein